MNAVEIEEAISTLAKEPFERDEFPYAFLTAFGNKLTTIKKLQSGVSNASDVDGGVLQRSHIHIATCDAGKVTAKLAELKRSPKTQSAKAKFILATDGEFAEAEDLTNGETVACSYQDIYKHFGFFLPLAGINTVREIRDNPIDIQATSRLNRLYLELIKENPDWQSDERRHDLNQLMTRLVFCFFAEDTGIFLGERLFTRTVEQMSDVSNTHEVIAELFRAMDIPPAERDQANLRPWASAFPYVNGGLFGGTKDIPRFSRAARSYFMHAGNLDWQQINPDIFGSMIQAVADDEERGALGMHYTSVPNILKVLNPLFLDDLRERLEECGDNNRMLLNLRKRMSKIRVFDPACGSGNFLVIAYKEMRKIEAEINRRRNESHLRSEIPLNNFRGIELRDFPAEIARLALIIAEYQCDVLYRGQKDAVADFLPLDRMNWITCGNALRLDWLSVFPPSSTSVRLHAQDLFHTPQDQAQIDFENEGGETYICGNPPYQGSVNQTRQQKDDMASVFSPVFKKYKDLDYVSAFLLKAAEFNKKAKSSCAFVTTNSITQGEQVSMLWPLIFKNENFIRFAHRSFLWSNLASNKAAVTCVILGISSTRSNERFLFDDGVIRSVPNISPYLVAADSVIVTKRTQALSNIGHMQSGNQPTDAGHLVVTTEEKERIILNEPKAAKFFKQYVGSREIINGGARWCIWVDEHDREEAESINEFRLRFEKVREIRQASDGKQANDHANTPHRFVFAPHSNHIAIAIPKVSSERRLYLPCAVTDGKTVVSNLASVIYDAPLWNLSLIASRLHLVWIATVCGKLKTDYRYSNILGWNTFPVPILTDKNKADLTVCAENILLARETHFPSTIADLYDPDNMPANLKEAHERNDEVLERIYIGRRFRNDTERLEKLFELYTKMASNDAALKSTKSNRTPKKLDAEELDL